MKDEELRDDIEENRDGDQITDRSNCAAQQFSATTSVKNKRPKKRGASLPCIFDPTPKTQRDGHSWLHDEAQSSRSRQTSQDMLKEALGEQVRITSSYYC